MIDVAPMLSMAALLGLVMLAFGFTLAWPRLKLRLDRWMATRKKAVCDQLAETDRQARIARTKAAIQRSLETKARECAARDPYLPAILESRVKQADQLDDDWFDKCPPTLRSGERPKE